jgi:putrescine transport system ATP-binding protein
MINVTPSKIQKPTCTGDPNYIQIIDVVKKFGTSTAVDNVSLSIAKNEVFGLLGSSGCGKSTLLRMMAGLETPTSGRILVDGVDLATMPPYHRPVNMMFQSYALFPHMTVEGNVAYGLKQEATPKKEIQERVQAALELVQMQDYAKRQPHQLSGGQQQRVALARSLVKRPKLLLLDEPMSALDKKIRQKTQFELGNILYKVGVTCMMVTHDQEEAMTMADRIAVMSAGKIAQIGTPNDVYEFPNSRFSAEFIGSTNMFEGELSDDDSDLVHCPYLETPLQTRHPNNLPKGAAITISVRPERIKLHLQRPNAASNCTRGVLEQMAYMGSYTLFYIRCPSGKMIEINVSRQVLGQLDSVPNYDDEVWLSWDLDSGVVLAK